MKFTLLNREINISEGTKNYMHVLHHFQDMGRQAKQDFRDEYNNRMGLVFLSSTYFEKFENSYGREDYMDKIVMRYVAQTRKFLTAYGIYDLSDTEIWDNAIITDDRSVSQLQYALNAFIDDLSDRDEEDSVIISRIKSKFESHVFESHLYNDVMALCDYTLEYLDKRKLTPIQHVYTDDANKARAIYQNLKDASISDDDLVEIMCKIPTNLSLEEFAEEYKKRLPAEIPYKEKAALASSLLELDPREASYYEYIFLNFPTAKHEIFAIAKHLGVDLLPLVEEDVPKSFDLKSITCEEDALKMKEDLVSYLQGFGLTQSPVLKTLDEILQDYDKQARTYDGVVYETRELRAKAEADDQELCALCSAKENANKEDLLSLISFIENKACDEGIKNKHTHSLQNKIREIEKNEMESILNGLDTATEAECSALIENIQAYDAVFAQKDTYITRIQNRIHAIWESELSAMVQDVDEMSEADCQIAKEKIQAHRAPEEMKSKYQKAADNRILAIWDAEDFERFSELFKQTPVGDSAVVGQNCALIQREGRTQTKESFMQALYFLNENEVAAAAKYALAKESGVFASLLNMGKKESYQILTLNGRVMHPAIEQAMQAQKEAKGNGLMGGFGKLKNSFGFGKSSAPAGKFCSNCGKPIASDSKFCAFCGNKVE